VLPPCECSRTNQSTDLRVLYTLWPHKLWSYWTEKQQIYITCREIIAGVNIHISIVTFYSILECQCDEWKWIGQFCRLSPKNWLLQQRPFSNLKILQRSVQFTFQPLRYFVNLHHHYPIYPIKCLFIIHNTYKNWEG